MKVWSACYVTVIPLRTRESQTFNQKGRRVHAALVTDTNWITWVQLCNKTTLFGYKTIWMSMGNAPTSIVDAMVSQSVGRDIPAPAGFCWVINNYIVKDWAVSRRYIGKHVPTNAHPTIEGRPLLGNRPVNTYHRNECATIGRPLVDNAWVDTPHNNTWNPLLSNWCVFCGRSVPILYKEFSRGICDRSSN
jgi:hypothetical protein